MLANTVVLWKSTIQSMQADRVAIREDKGHSDPWHQLNSYLNNRRINKTINNPIPITLPQGILKVGVLSTFIPAATTLQPSLSQNRSLVKSAPVPLPTLHSQEENRRQAADLYEQLERDSVLGANSTGELHNNNSKRLVKSSTGHTGGPTVVVFKLGDLRKQASSNLRGAALNT